MLQRFSQILSYVMHPFLMPVLGCVMILFGTTFLVMLPLTYKMYILGMVALCTLIIPGISIFMLKRLSLITNLSLETREDRILPLIVVGVSYFMCAYMLSGVMSVLFVGRIVYGALTAISACFVVNMYWKISLHMTASGGILGVLLATNILGFGYMPWMLMFWIVMTGLLACARLYMGQHNIWQVSAGVALGTASTYLAVYL